MQNLVVGQETACRTDWPGEGRRDQVVPVRVAMLPVADTTTQNVGDTHEMSCTGLVAVPSSTRVSWPQLDPLNVVTTPAVLTDAQNVDDVQDTRYWPPVTLEGATPTAVDIDHDVPVKTTACWPARATQNVGDLQDTLSRVPPDGTGRGVDHALPFQLTALPDSSTAWQNELDVHETP
jgi:hypothetical protein